MVDEFGCGVYDKEQWLPESMQLFGVKIPPAPLSLHDIMPIKVVDGLEVSATVAVNVTAFPEVNVAGFGVIVVVVLLMMFVDICDVIKLPK